MLRTSLRSVKAVGSRPVAAAVGRQWQPAIARSAGAAGRRCYADNKKPSINDSTPAKLPTSETTTAASSDPPALKTEAKVASSTIDSKEVPHTPPPPPPVPESAAEKTNSKPAPPQPAPLRKKKGFFRRLYNYTLTLILLGAITFAGGVWYSRISDNFHDFFTEYVPFGEKAVLYLEELDYKKRYPGGLTIGGRGEDTGAHVKISPQSGASWRVADAGEPAGRQSSAMRDITASKTAASKAASSSSGPESNPAAKPAEAPKPAAPEPTPAAAPQAAEKKAEPPKKETVGFVPPEVDEPSRFPPPAPIDPLGVNDAQEPVVQDLVKMLNDIITVVNADNADGRFSSTVEKAKSELNKVGSKIREMKAQVEQDAASEVAAKVREFEDAAVELVSRVERAMNAQEKRWRAEFEEEIRRIQAAYDSRIKTEIERERQLNEARLNNLLIEQAVNLKRQFLREVKNCVEEERNSRLGKLEQLSNAVRELEQLTTGWNDVVDMTLKTQQLHVAVEAVRASLSDAEHPRPFVKELVALKEIATDDPVVNAAVGSINPSAYQRGIATPSQLIDRFRRVASEVRKASLLPDDAGVASHASSWVLSKVLFKKQGLATGNDVESILTRTQTLLEEGDLDAAAREMNGLQGWAKTLSRDWLAEVRKVLEVQQALDVIASEARLQSLRVE